MAIAGIGALPDTVEDRSVTIVMKRKLRFERVERLTRRNNAARAEASLFASKLTRFAADNLESLRNAEPPIPDALNDRAADNWEHLLAIADLAGNTWGALAREAAVELSGDRENTDNDSLRTRLLADIYDILEEEAEEQISSTDLCVALVKVETAPWPELSRGKPISPARLARMLKPFEIYPGKIDMGRTRGYKKSDFKDAFNRYLSRITPDQTVKVSEPPRGEEESLLSQVSSTDTLKSTASLRQRTTSDALTPSKPPIGPKGKGPTESRRQKRHMN